ncbi:MAG TPA: PQQ-dependent sugar dehydrogenase, partial [Rubrobacteraceae bacterium]|nr:PQQ-dependent sugar dehydrogenase [Rubrobacteraceae bacterium]
MESIVETSTTLRNILLGIVVAAVAGFIFIDITARPAEAAVSLPAGFEDRPVTTVGGPTAMAFTPDGRMLITTQQGQVRVYKEGAATTTQAVDISSKICSNSERGLLGIAVDPNFDSNNYVYLYYTYNRAGVCPYHEPESNQNPVNRVSRFVMSGDDIVASSEKVLITNIPSPNGNHNAGDLHFGKDDNLYISVGDGACSYAQPTKCGLQNDVSRQTNGLNGKILRITRDGGIPATNPYTGPDSVRCNVQGHVAPGKNCKEIFARGLRNPFRMAFDPDASAVSFRIDDVGAASWEEVDVGKRGADYAWNLCEGRHDNASREGSVRCSSAPYTPPIHEYSHNTGCSSITGGAFVPDNATWPTSYNNSYLFGDYVCGKIFKLTPKSGGGFTKTAFATGLGQGGPVAMTYGPFQSAQALYYTTYAGGDGGQIRRIVYTGGNRTPNAVAEANPPYAESPGDLTIDFSGAASQDPDQDPLTYAWDFDYADGNFQADPSATGSTPSHTYATAGKRIAALRVTDDKGLSEIATVEVFPGNTQPQPTIESPTPDKL